MLVGGFLLLVTASSFISFIRGTTGRSRCLQLKEKPTAANRLRLVLFLPSATGRREKLFSFFFLLLLHTRGRFSSVSAGSASTWNIFFQKKKKNSQISRRCRYVSSSFACAQSNQKVKNGGTQRRLFLGELRESKRSAFRPLNDAILSRYQRQQQAPSVHVWVIVLFVLSFVVQLSRTYLFKCVAMAWNCSNVNESILSKFNGNNWTIYCHINQIIFN